jgi:hypothetical protein
MNLRSVMACGMVLHIMACDTRRDETAGRETADTAQAPAPADSLVATAPGGIEIWFTFAREGKGADGTR